MANEIDLTRAKQVYQDFCAMMDREDWKYKKDEKDLLIETGGVGDDLPIALRIKVDAERQLIRLYSLLPFKIVEDKRLDAAVAVSVINNMLVDGCLEYDISEGNLFFRMTSSYRDSQLGNEVYKYLLFCAGQTIDHFNDKLLMLSKGYLSLEQFIEQYNKE